MIYIIWLKFQPSRKCLSWCVCCRHRTKSNPQYKPHFTRACIHHLRLCISFAGAIGAEINLLAHGPYHESFSPSFFESNETPGCLSARYHYHASPHRRTWGAAVHFIQISVLFYPFFSFQCLNRSMLFFFNLNFMGTDWTICYAIALDSQASNLKLGLKLPKFQTLTRQKRCFGCSMIATSYLQDEQAEVKCTYPQESYKTFLKSFRPCVMKIFHESKWIDVVRRQQKITSPEWKMQDWILINKKNIWHGKLISS